MPAPLHTSAESRVPSSRVERGFCDDGILVPDGTESDDFLLPLMAMTRHLSEVHDTHELFRLASAYTADAPITGEHHATLVVDATGLPPGQYRITRRHLCVPNRLTVVEVGDLPEAMPVHTGGFVSTVLRKKYPALVRGFDLVSDPVLGQDYWGLDSCLVIPMFTQGRPVKRALFFRRNWSEVHVDHVSRVMLTMGLIESAIENIQIADFNRQLALSLDAQFEQVGRIQRGLLPRPHPERPFELAEDAGTRAGVEIGVFNRAASRAGGDYFDVFTGQGGELFVLVCDVAGHGADAAMIMSLVHAVMHSNPPLDRGPAEVLTYLNAHLRPRMPAGRFVTACVACIDRARECVRYSTAGHPAPRLRPPGPGAVPHVLDDANGYVLGILDDGEFSERERPFPVGSLLVCYSDGLSESLCDGGEMFGTRVLDDTIAHSSGSASDLARRVIEEADRRRGGAEPTDDITVVVLQARA